MQNLVPPYTDDVIRRMAEECLREHHPENTIPVPIEEIVEIKFKMDVVPMNSLRARHDIDGYIARDAQTIYVDGEVCSRQNPSRLRFTLAHELAHIRLHPRVFVAAKYDDVEGWIEFVQSIPAYQLTKIESQARTMAGYLLVPRDHFQREYAAIANLLTEKGFDITNMNNAVFSRVLAKLGDVFKVSSSVIARQGAREGVWDWEDIPDNV